MQDTANTNEKREVREAHVDEAIVASARGSEATPAYGRHQYVKVEVVDSDADLLVMLERMPAVCPLHSRGEEMPDVDVCSYMKELIAFEDARAAAGGLQEVRKTRYGMLITVMLPLEMTKNQYAPFVCDLMRELPCHCAQKTWFARSTKRGKATYVVIFVNERDYYSEPHLFETYQKGDSFRDSVTGRRCRKDCPTAIPWRKDGDLLKTEYSQFSPSKGRELHLNSRGTIAFVLSIKRICRALFDLLHQFLKETPMLFRYKGDGFFGQRGRTIRRYNRMFAKIENILEDHWYALHAGGIFSEDAFLRLLSELRQLQLNYSGQYRTGNSHFLRYTVCFHGAPDYIDSSIDFVMRKMTACINRFTAKMKKQVDSEIALLCA